MPTRPGAKIVYMRLGNWIVLVCWAGSLLLLLEALRHGPLFTRRRPPGMLDGGPGAPSALS